MEQNKNFSVQVISGFIWKFAERIAAQGVSFIISLILARLLMPDEYGTVALVLVFINIANVLVSDGLGESLIQKENADDVDFSTMFFCSLGLGIVLYLLLFLFAPLISEFYKNDQLTVVIRVLALQVPLSAIKTIQNAYVSKHMLFKKFFFSTLGGTVFSGVVGIIMAYAGLGVWALVEQYLVNSLIDSLILFITVKWRPHWKFSMASAKQLISYGWKILAAQLINVFYGEMRSLVIGKVYTAADLAYYNKGSNFPSLIITNINTSISTVLFPAMAKVNNDVNNIKTLTRRSMKMSSYVIFPMMVGMAVVAEPMIKVLLTDKWLPVVPFLQLCCAYWMFQPCQTANVQAIKAIGRSDICLKLEIVKKIIGFTIVLGTMFISVYAVVLSNVFFAGISAAINIIPNRKLIHYGLKEQVCDLLPALMLSLGMGLAVYLVSFLNLEALPMLIVQVLVGGVVYLAESVLFKVEEFTYFKNIILKKKNAQ